MIVLTTRGAEAFLDALTAAGVRHQTIPAGPDLNPVLVGRLARVLRAEAPTLVHTHLIHADVHGQVAARVAGVPAVSSVHGAHGFYRRHPTKDAARLAGHLARRTIAISGHVGHLLCSEGLVSPERLRVVHYGIDADLWDTGHDRAAARARLGLRDGEAAVGVASRLIPHKGHAALIRAVATARRRGVRLRLVVAGDGPLRASLESLARTEAVDDTVFLGFVNDVGAVLAACDLFVFPTEPALSEGFGLAALEAMAAGLPVVATNVASLPEVVVDGETGLLVPPGDVAAMARALQALALDPALRARLGAAGRRRAAERFSLGHMVEATVAVYEEVLAEHDRRGGL